MRERSGEYVINTELGLHGSVGLPDKLSPCEWKT